MLPCSDSANNRTENSSWTPPPCVRVRAIKLGLRQRLLQYGPVRKLEIVGSAGIFALQSGIRFWEADRDTIGDIQARPLVGDRHLLTGIPVHTIDRTGKLGQCSVSKMDNRISHTDRGSRTIDLNE